MEEAAKEAAKGTGTREFRMEELAREAGITVRTLRFYRERKLIPPPRREGRIAWYDESHLARLRTIAALLERGHTLSGIAELSEAFDRGRDVGELLGLVEPSEETPVRLTPRNWPTTSPTRSPRRTSKPRWTSATSASTARRSSTSKPAPARRLGRPGPRGRPARRRTVGRQTRPRPRGGPGRTLHRPGPLARHGTRPPAPAPARQERGRGGTVPGPRPRPRQETRRVSGPSAYLGDHQRAL